MILFMASDTGLSNWREHKPHTATPDRDQLSLMKTRQSRAYTSTRKKRQCRRLAVSRTHEPRRMNRDSDKAAPGLSKLKPGRRGNEIL